jgi:hypothetical protein
MSGLSALATLAPCSPEGSGSFPVWLACLMASSQVSSTLRLYCCPPAVYRASDYCDIMEHLIARWDIEHREGLSGEAAEAQVRRSMAWCGRVVSS